MDSARLCREMKDLELCEQIVKTLSADGPQRVLLIGKSGIGKTRLARKVGEYATTKGLCFLTLCLHLNNKFEDELSLYENIAFQIEVYDMDDKGKDKEDLLKDLKKEISAELHKRYELAERKLDKGFKKWRPYLLLILDDEGNMTSEDTVMKELGFQSFLNFLIQEDSHPKLFITRRIADEDTKRRDKETEESQETEHEEIMLGTTTYPYDDTKRHDGEIESYATAEPDTITTYQYESEYLLNTLTEDNMRDLFESLIEDEARELLESLQKDWKMDEPLTSRVARNSINLPAAIVVLAKSLNCITQQDTFKSLSSKQERALKKVLSPCEAVCSDRGYNPILHLAYELLESDDTLNNAIVDCFWHSLDFFKHCGCVYYSDLITQWILEGYFDPVRSVKMAYKDGHEILLELINRGILNIQEGDMVVPEMAMNNLIDLRYHGLLGRSRLRFARVYGGDKKKGLGKPTQIDDMIKSVQAKNGENIQTLLVSGNRLRRETPEDFFKQMTDLEVLGLFAPTVDPLIPSLKVLQKLRVLVIRDYDLLQSDEMLGVEGLRKLEVLEVSGASSLRAISDEFFTAMSQLQSLNLSGLQISGSPSSISLLRNLRCLILRDCLVLKNLPDIQNLEKLEVVDVRGTRMLRTCFGMRENSRRNRTFSRLQQLQILDFSETKIIRLPTFHGAAMATELHSLTRLSLRNCSNLIKLPNLKPLSGLQILDLSGTTNLVEIAAVCFEQKEELKVLNLSGTNFSKLPSTISGLSNLSQLLIRDSSNLEALPNVEKLISLEILDVSGCTKLHKIEGSFKGMSYLREVNLSGSKIETLPEFPEKSSICCLKVIVLADLRTFKDDTWEQVEEAMKNRMSDRVQEISRTESVKVDEIWAFDCPEKKGGRMEDLYQSHTYRDVFMNTIPFVGTKNYQEVLEIRGSNGIDQDKETLAKAELVVFVDNGAASLSFILNDMKLLKGCWLEMCRDIKILFSGVDAERLRNLETLSITNLGRLKSISSSSSSFENMKQLSIDCCPRIKTLFPESAILTSLEVLKIKFCEELRKVFEEEVELPNLHTLCLFELPELSTIGAKLPNLETYKDNKCPQLKTSKEKLKEGSCPI